MDKLIVFVTPNVCDYYQGRVSLIRKDNQIVKISIWGKEDEDYKIRKRGEKTDKKSFFIVVNHLYPKTKKIFSREMDIMALKYPEDRSKEVEEHRVISKTSDGERVEIKRTICNPKNGETSATIELTIGEDPSKDDSTEENPCRKMSRDLDAAENYIPEGSLDT